MVTTNGNGHHPEIRNDGAFANALVGIGTELDKTEYTTLGITPQLTKAQKEELVRREIPRRICHAYPLEATREGWNITLGGDDQDSKILQELDSYRSQVGAAIRDPNLLDDEEGISDYDLIQQAGIHANTYGGAALVLDIDDGAPPDEPIRKDRIKTIRSVEMLHCYQLQPDLTTSWSANRPLYYDLLLGGTQHGDRLQNMFGDKAVKGRDKYSYKIHRSRVIRFDGITLPSDAMRDNRQCPGWGQSLLDSIWNEFKQFGEIMGEIGAIVADYSLFVYFLDGLSEEVKKPGAEEKIKTRLRLLRKGANLLGGVALDAKKEKVEFVTRGFAGLDTLADKFLHLLVAVSGLPTTVILGRGPLGLAAQGTGDAEERVWAKQVGQYQSSVLRSKLRRLYQLIFLAKDGPTKGKEPENWAINFKPLILESQQEKVDLRASAINAYLSCIQSEVLMADEVRNSLFGGSEFSIDITLDQEAWEKKKQQAEQEALGGFGGYGDYGAAPAEEAPVEEAPQEEAAPPAEEPATEEPMQTDSLWSRNDTVFANEKLHQVAIAEAKRKFKVYPSRWAGVWIAKRYKELLGEKS